MDTFTHGIIGALAARSCTKADVRAYLTITAIAAAFPDIDYLLFWLNPYKFITEWHRGVTHSIIMIPLWATLISLVFYRALRKKLPFRGLFACCCLGLSTHIATDLITLYGVQLFAPLSNRRYALFTVFDMDPLIGLLAVLGLGLSYFKRRFAIFGLAAILSYLLLLIMFQQSALNILESRMAQPKQIEHSYAIPQPFLPFHWKLVVDRHDHYEIAHLSLFENISTFISKQITVMQTYGVLPASAGKNINNTAVNMDLKKNNFMIAGTSDFRNADSLEWRKAPKFGDDVMSTKLARQVWQHDAFSAFRNFATIPILYRVDRDPDSDCVWFTDLRYVFPIMMPPFRYGMCRNHQNDHWKIFRLRRHTENSRQLIGN